jgi:hypothetical protein
MIISGYPMAYQSAFRPARFVLTDVEAPEGLDVEILPATGSEVLGVKRIWGQGEFAVNVAPYVRSLLSPLPLCDKAMGVNTDRKRYAICRVSAAGVTSDVAYLTAGTVDAPTDVILSAAPDRLTIRKGEKDEITVITTGGGVTPSIIFPYGGLEYSDNIYLGNSSTGMHTFVVDEAMVASRFAGTTGLARENMREFIVMLSSGDIQIKRRYVVDATPHRGRRLAWVNRYGAIDYYTFPDTDSRTLSGGRGRILSSAGWSTVATKAEDWTSLTSDYEEGATLEWLAEILSSPRVWIVEGNKSIEVDVADGSVLFDPTLPGNMTLKVRPSAVVVSRKL